jgi:hypothetical protein
MQWNESSLSAVRDQHESWLMQQTGVSGVGIGANRQGHVCLKILTHSLSAPERNRIRNRLGDVPLEFEETGPINALGLD